MSEKKKRKMKKRERKGREERGRETEGRKPWYLRKYTMKGKLSPLR